MTTTSTDAALDAVAQGAAALGAAEIALALRVVDWAVEHELTGEDAVGYGFAETGIALGGTGCPIVSEFDVYDLAAVMGKSSDAGCSYVGKVLETRYRLPRLWTRLVAGEVPVWKAFRVAELTMLLPVEGALWVDTHLAPVAHSCSFAQIGRTVKAAIIRFDPDEAARRAAEAAEHRDVQVFLHSADASGIVDVTGRLDLADAVDLEQALQAGAAALAAAGSENPLGVRRAKALGDLARGQAVLDLEPGGRALTIHVHSNGDTTLEQPDTNVLLDQLREWCATAGNVTIKPVIDLNARIESTGYEPSPRLREQVMLRDRTCVFPHCTRPARACDLDHIVPWDQGGPTSSDNLACLCRRHHRAKTHSAWSYAMVEPGLYAWTTPTGRTHTVDRRRRP